MKKVVLSVETISIDKLPSLVLYASKCKSGSICDILISEYFDEKQKFGWLSISNVAQVLEWHYSKKEAIEYRIKSGFDVYCFDLDNEDYSKKFIDWLLDE
jgi:hypothetical protein